MLFYRIQNVLSSFIFIQIMIIIIMEMIPINIIYFLGKNKNKY